MVQVKSTRWQDNLMNDTRVAVLSFYSLSLTTIPSVAKNYGGRVTKIPKRRLSSVVLRYELQEFEHRMKWKSKCQPRVNTFSVMLGSI